MRPPLDLCKATGVTLGAGSRVIVMPDKGGVADALTASCRQQGVEVLRFEAQPDADALSSTSRVDGAGPVQGVYWLPALDDEEPSSSMDLVSWREALRVRVKSLYVTAMALCTSRSRSAGTFLVSATRLGGQHGYDRRARRSAGRRSSGLHQDVSSGSGRRPVKAVDFEAGRKAAEMADALIAETCSDPGAVEIGYKDGCAGRSDFRSNLPPTASPA